jgi:hypothetical protein
MNTTRAVNIIGMVAIFAVMFLKRRLGRLADVGEDIIGAPSVTAMA